MRLIQNAMFAAVPSGSISLKTALRQKILNVALTSREFRETLAEAAAEIRALATQDATEATVESAFERVLYAQLREIGLKFNPLKEQTGALRRHVTRGRMDSRLGALVIEYKRPALLKSPAETERALSQLKEYLGALSETAATPIVGFLTNGLVAFEVRAQSGDIISVSTRQRVGENTLLRLTRQFVSLALAALTPANLIRDFCGSEWDGVLFETARVLNAILSNGLQPKTGMLFREWEEIFRLAHDDQSQQRRIEERRAALASVFSIEIADAAGEYRALFALHTAYAILLKFIAYRTVSDIHPEQPNQDYHSLLSASDTALRGFCSALEDGELFRLLGIINLLEGDFFSWYCDRKQWTPALAASIKSILTILARYEEAGLLFDQNEAADLFRDLYQAAVPRVVRSSFGEFYTPHWLAQHVLETARPIREWRVIDPCCGSGTFVIAAIAKLRAECEAQGLRSRETLQQILSRVVAVDLNPLSVLTARINYFIHISNLLPPQLRTGLVIPVFLGDAAVIPERISIDGVDCLSLELKTLQNPIRAALPVSVVQDTPHFMQLMLTYERQINAQNCDAANAHMLGAVPASERTPGVQRIVEVLTRRLVELEARGWNGIWVRILSNFFTTACLGKFSIVFGNPPWIDWKNLPEAYRERIKTICTERGLFSGAGRTGGINLNICALIAYVSLTNWLDRNGRLAFLMPRELANQPSYEGWRRLGGKWNFLQFDNWTDAGHPFDPVREDFMTFVIASEKRRTRSVPVRDYVQDPHAEIAASDYKSLDEATEDIECRERIAGQIIPGGTAFTFADDQGELEEFALVAGNCEYIGREGIEFYPQELLLFRYSGPGPQDGTVWLRNVQVKKSRYRIQERRILVETEFLHPLAKGPEIKRFHHAYSGLVVAFPYEEADPIRPIPADQLRQRSPLLLNYYEQARRTIEQQTKFSDKIRGPEPGEFYGLARTGPYSFADIYVAFRDNTKWVASVITDREMEWGERKRFVFQNHAVSMCERRSGGLIAEDEAHFVCAILNTPIVERFIRATSDDRSYKIRPPVFVPGYDPDDDRHGALVALSRRAHAMPECCDAIRASAEQLYLSLVRTKPRVCRNDAASRRKMPEMKVRGATVGNPV